MTDQLTHAFRVIRTAVDTLETHMLMLLEGRDLDRDVEVISEYMQRAEKAEARVRELESENAKLRGERIALPDFCEKAVRP